MALGGPRLATVRLDQTTSSTSWAVPYGTGVALGELMLILVGGPTSATSPTAAGWTLIGSASDTTAAGGSAHVLGKLALAADVTASAAAGSVTVTMPSSLGTAVMVVQPGAADPTFLDVAASTYATGGTESASYVLPSVTTVGAAVRIFYFASFSTATTTATGPAGSLEVFDWGGLGLARPGVLYYDTVDQATAGATGTRTVTLSVARKGGGVLFPIRPAAAASMTSSAAILSGSGTFTPRTGKAATGTALRVGNFTDSMGNGLEPLLEARFPGVDFYDGSVGGESVTEIKARFYANGGPGAHNIIRAGHNKDADIDTAAEVPIMVERNRAGVAEMAAESLKAVVCQLGMNSQAAYYVDPPTTFAELLWNLAYQARRDTNAAFAAAYPPAVYLRIHDEMIARAYALPDLSAQDITDLQHELLPFRWRATVGDGGSNDGHYNTAGKAVAVDVITDHLVRYDFMLGAALAPATVAAILG